MSEQEELEIIIGEISGTEWPVSDASVSWELAYAARLILQARAERDAALSELAAADADWEACHTELKAAQARIEAYECLQASTKEAIDTFEVENRRLKSKCDGASLTRDQLEQEAGKLELRINALEAENAELRKKVKAALAFAGVSKGVAWMVRTTENELLRVRMRVDALPDDARIEWADDFCTVGELRAAMEDK